MSKVFNLSNVKTCVNADDVCVGDYGYFGDSVGELKDVTCNKVNAQELKDIKSDRFPERFALMPKGGKSFDYFALFYPLEGAK